MVVACSTYGRQQSCIQGLVGKPEEEGPLGKHRGRLEDNIKMYLEEEWGMGWVWLSIGKDGGFL